MEVRPEAASGVSREAPQEAQQADPEASCAVPVEATSGPGRVIEVGSLLRRWLHVCPC